MFVAALFVPAFMGCGGSVDTAPATEAASDDGDIATEGMTEEETAEFEAGEGGA